MSLRFTSVRRHIGCVGILCSPHLTYVPPPFWRAALCEARASASSASLHPSSIPHIEPNLHTIAHRTHHTSYYLIPERAPRCRRLCMLPPWIPAATPPSQYPALHPTFTLPSSTPLPRHTQPFTLPSPHLLPTSAPTPPSPHPALHPTFTPLYFHPAAPAPYTAPSPYFLILLPESAFITFTPTFTPPASRWTVAVIAGSAAALLPALAVQKLCLTRRGGSKTRGGGHGRIKHPGSPIRRDAREKRPRKVCLLYQLYYTYHT